MRRVADDVLACAAWRRFCVTTYHSFSHLVSKFNVALEGF
jgi:hypothetical protein